MTEFEEKLGNLIRVNHQGLRELLMSYYNAKLSLMCWGTIGIGKSQEIEATGKAIGEAQELEFQKDVIDPKKFCMIDVRLSQVDATDIKGIPFKNKDATACTWLLPDWLPSDPKSKGILFFDEINLAPPSIQASAYSLILDRKIGNYILPEGWICVSAGNRIEDKVANLFEMSPALEDRYGHCELLIPGAEAWRDWALDHNINKYIISFILWNPAKLMMYRPEEQTRVDLKEKAFATPRSWEHSSLLIDGVNIMDFDKIERLIATKVGLGNAMEFIAFLKLRQDIKFKEIIQNPEKVKEFEKREDLLYTLVTVISDWYKKNCEKQHLQRICQIAENMRGEFAILMLRYCKEEHKQKFKNMIKTIPEWKNTLSPLYGEYVIG